MTRKLFPSALIVRPTPTEAVALAGAAAYLNRAGTAVASRLLGADDTDSNAALAAALRDQFLAGAALCHGLLDSSDPLTTDVSLARQL
jgi:hypothetical protein